MEKVGFRSSSLAAATLREFGLRRATDLDGGYQAWRRLVARDRVAAATVAGDSAERTIGQMLADHVAGV